MGCKFEAADLLRGLASALKANWLADVIQLLAGRGVAAVVALATTVAIARGLGPKDTGLFTAVQTYFMLVIQVGNFGVHSAFTYFVARGEIRPGEAFVTTVRIFVPLIFFSILVMSLILPRIDSSQGLSSLGLIILIFWGVFELLFIQTQGICMGMGRTALVSVGEIMRRALPAALLAFVLPKGLSVAEAFFVLAIGACSAGVMLAYYIRRDDGADLRRPSWQRLAPLLRYGLSILGSGVLSYLVARSGVLLGARLLPQGDVGLYSSAIAISEGLSLLPATIGIVVFSRLSGAGVKRSNWGVLIKYMGGLVALMILPALVLALFSEALLQILFGAAFIGAKDPLIILLFGLPSVTLATISQNVLAAAGHQRAVIFGPLLGTILSFFLGSFAISSFGIKGAAVSTVIGSSAWATVSFLMARGLMKRQNGA